MTAYWYVSMDTSVLKAYPMWANKLTGYAAIRGTWVVRVEVSAPNTVASRLRLLSKPPEYNSSFNNALQFKKGFCSQFPGVEIDVSNQTSATLRVPMRFNKEFASLQYNENAWGTVALLQYSPFHAVSGTVNFSLWLSFEDAELAQPLPVTMATVTAQSDNTGAVPISENSIYPTTAVNAPAQEPSPSKSVQLNAPDTSMYVNPDLLAIVVGCTSALKIAKDAMLSFSAQGPSTGAQELSKVPTGNLSAILGAASTISTSVGNMIPAISSYTGTASWVARVGARLASSYGYSKPRDNKIPTATSDRFMSSENNSEGTDGSVSLGAFSDNCINTMPNPCGSTMDEMSLPFLLSVPCCINTITFSTQAVGNCIYACQLCPRAMFTQSSKQNVSTEKVLNTLYDGVTAPKAIIGGPLCALAHSFALWRGGFRFVLKFAKTKMHKGRLLLTYTPVHPKADTSATTSFTGPSDLSNAMYGQCICIDLSQDSEFVYDVPFTCTDLYLPTTLGFGWFSMWVVEPLGYTSTVSTSISFNVEVSAVPGFEFATPIRPCLAPVVNNYSNVYAQSSSTGPQPMDKVPTISVATSATCIGEKLNSVKQLLTRSSYWLRVAGGAQTNPYNIVLPTVGATSIDMTNFDLLSHYAPWYTYMRGGMTIKAFTRDGFVRATLHSHNISSIPSKGNGIQPITGSAFEKRNIISVYIPQYSCGVARAIGYTNGSLTDLASESPTFSLGYYDATGTTTVTNGQYSRVVSDEFQLLGFVCCPLMVISPNNSQLGTIT